MRRERLIFGTAMLVLLSVLLTLSGWLGPWLASLAGLVLVAGGTFLAAVAGYSLELVWRVALKFPGAFRPIDMTISSRRAMESFLVVAEWLRRGNMRMAEQWGHKIGDEFLRRGVLMVVDRTPQREMMRTLQWRIGREKEQDQQEIRLVRSMAGYAPALGMLGTLLGLVQMLFGLGDKPLGEVGVAMGFAMLTTIYGLIGSNLLLKPLAGKLEQRSRERIAWMYAELEVVVMLTERSHPVHIREALETYLERRRDPVVLPALSWPFKLPFRSIRNRLAKVA